VSVLCIAGDISLKVPASLESEVDLKADSVAVDKQLDTAAVVCTTSNGQQHVTGMSSGDLDNYCAKMAAK